MTQRATIILENDTKKKVLDYNVQNNNKAQTTLRLSNHERNVFKAMTILGMAKNQRDAVRILQELLLNSLSLKDRQSLLNMTNILDQNN